MNQKHTRGPWKFSDDSAYFKTNPFSVYVQGLGVHKTTVANIPFRKTIPEDEARANARLITSAPKLLEALQAMLACVHDEERDDETIEAVRNARHAVQEATKETA
jgi:transaldolase